MAEREPLYPPDFGEVSEETYAARRAAVLEELNRGAAPADKGRPAWLGVEMPRDGDNTALFNLDGYIIRWAFCEQCDRGATDHYDGETGLVHVRRHMMGHEYESTQRYLDRFRKVAEEAGVMPREDNRDPSVAHDDEMEQSTTNLRRPFNPQKAARKMLTGAPSRGGLGLSVRSGEDI